MKKVFIFLGLLLFIISNTYAIDIYNQNKVAQTYFSLNGDHVFVESNTALPNLNVSYMIFNFSRYVTYVFEECGNKYCADFYLSKLIENDGGTFVSSTQFKVFQGTDIKTIYLDIEAPILNIKNISVNTSAKKINVKYNFSDDSNQIDRIDFYSKENNDLKFIKEISKQTEISLDIDNTRTYILVFKIYDVAGNSYEVQKEVTVNDIFNPKIESVFLIKRSSGYQLEFKLTDANLTKYEIIQNGLTLSEDINKKTTYEKTVNIPFTSGDVLLKAIDGQGNSVTKTLSLKSLISQSSKLDYSSSKTFEFKSNADKCYIISVSGKTYSKYMEKSSNRFYYKLNIDDVKEYTVEYYCEYNNYREYFSSDFFYDTNEPTQSIITIESLDNGNLKLEWTEAKDSESDVSYRLYRDGDKIYDGSKLKYEDSNVEYPNSYEYYIMAYDKAENEKKSELVSGVPNKVKVALTTSLDDKDTTFVQTETYNFNVNSEQDASIVVTVKNNGQIVDQQNLQNIQASNQNFNVKLASGANNIEIVATDKLGNIESKSYFITYTAPIAAEVPQNEIIVEPVVETKIEVQNTTPIVAETVKDEDGYGWIWFIIILILFIYFIWFFVFNEDKRKKNFSSFGKQQKNGKFSMKKDKKGKKEHFNFIFDKLLKDNRLEKDFNRIKKERIARQAERVKEAEKRKKNEEKNTNQTALQKEKMKDLGRKKEINIPLTTRAKAKVSHRKIHKEPTYEEDLQSTKEMQENSKHSFFSRNKLHQAEDEMTSYLQKIKSTPSWTSTRDYVYKAPEPPKPEPKISTEDGLTPSKDIPEQKKRFSFFSRQEPVQEDIVTKETPTQSQSIKEEKIDMNSFLDDIVKKKKGRRFFLAEKSVDRDINDRNR